MSRVPSRSTAERTASVGASPYLVVQADYQLAGGPDFHVDLGDTFMCEKYSAPFTGVNAPAHDRATVDARYAFERAQFGLVGRSAPLFLVNGNHEGEAGWAANGTGESLAVWTTQARQRFQTVALAGGSVSRRSSPR